ncbi:4a-hydroxytetrahydrobiopterin dehydratase [Aliirhizobium terrae]|uniref:4a-hydroxytetrahydrobiopterin dehydratase n=1 Tax=Terrirhizobium terrae TaxID=2926709 RepID=UPI002578A1FC|nr:4a-hydroxytetrahydrobiopterin dehydratase [Rhizobium sp. CC-CFT758]WJH41360.1 4a-hydroxytetrahydrobiopterin dehydratase [Rhizobium sp. CC-CFT758]
MAYELLDAEAVSRELVSLDSWHLSADGLSISKSFKFDNFIEAFDFMTEAAIVAEKLNHHPDWSNSYSRVDVSLTTHAKKQLTDRDFKLAAAMDKAAARRS